MAGKNTQKSQPEEESGDVKTETSKTTSSKKPASKPAEKKIEIKPTDGASARAPSGRRKKSASTEKKEEDSIIDNVEPEKEASSLSEKADESSTEESTSKDADTPSETKSKPDIAEWITPTTNPTPETFENAHTYMRSIREGFNERAEEQILELVDKLKLYISHRYLGLDSKELNQVVLGIILERSGGNIIEARAKYKKVVSNWVQEAPKIFEGAFNVLPESLELICNDYNATNFLGAALYNEDEITKIIAMANKKTEMISKQASEMQKEMVKLNASMSETSSNWLPFLK